MPTPTLVNRQYKDSVFSRYFSEPQRLIELYNSIKGAHYPPDADVDIQTLEDVLFHEQINDLAFLLEHRLIILIEHQSTINLNLPLRLLLYIARVYEKVLDNADIYKRGLIKIPKPEFIVLYNADAFKEADIPDLLELKVAVYNINEGCNAELLRRSRSLSEYAAFVAQVRRGTAEKQPLETAVKNAIRYCLANDVMGEFLTAHGSEVENMIMTEFNLETAKQVWREEWLEEGREEGREEGVELGMEKSRRLTIQNMKRENLPDETIARIFNMTVEEVQQSLN
ncbi:MAG: hypothetical protein LBT22_01650 [Peptococcaceae bacterium]|jgi:predicted transposase/invertase (TIGR01784 family)|nr:hypothetical protein [Peptococcaceae bacterium]